MASKTPHEIITGINPKSFKKEYNLIYDSTNETLEPLYFWILDFMNDMFDKVEKISDNFASSPGSGHFSELMAKGTRMQEEGMKVMQTVGVLIKSLINIVYDLRQFETVLSDYEKANSSNSETAKAGELALKQRWLDKVDIQKGNTSIKAMTFGNASFATLLDAFMIIKDEKLKDLQGKELDLNDRVKRLLIQRISEYNTWRKQSERELKKRFNIEKTWLKNQVASLKLYSKWAKPYLRNAEKLKMQGESDAALVKAFNTINLQLTLFGQGKPFDVEAGVIAKDLPEEFSKMKKLRKYYSCILVDFNFRGIPQKAGQHYVFGGRAEVKFRAYALSDQELALFKKKLEENELQESMDLVETATTETLSEIQEDIEYFLKKEVDDEEIEKQKSSEQDVNPFSALIGLDKMKKKDKKEKTKEKTEQEKKDEEFKSKYGYTEKELSDIEEKIKTGKAKDNYAEDIIRKMVHQEAKGSCYTVYDIYKKAHGMASTPQEV